jgi:hypothetical protein
LGYKHVDGQHRVVMAAVAPAENVHAVGADIGKRGRLGQVVGHPDIRN